MDLLIEVGARILGIECKSGATFSSDAFAELEYFARSLRADPLQKRVVPAVVYGGGETQARSAGAVLSWSDIAAWLDENVE